MKNDVGEAGRSRSSEQAGRSSAKRCPFVCLKGSRINGRIFWGMALTSRSGASINHVPARFSASLLVTFVSCARDRGTAAVYLLSNVTLRRHTSWQPTLSNTQTALRMWWRQLSRRNLLKEEIDFRESLKCWLRGCEADAGNKKTSRSLLNKTREI